MIFHSSKRISRAVGSFIILFLAGSTVCPASGSSIIEFEKVSLSNGLQVILAPDRSVPVVTMAMMIPVGARQERFGRSGFSHLFEHLMFEGSDHVPKGRFDKILEGVGADNNASAHLDFTYYYETLPANALPVALWLDADRLSSLDVSEQNLRNQVEVVKEEKRLNVINEAYAPLLWVEIASRTFSNWANAHDTYGLFKDLEAAELKDVRKFFFDHYSPSNTTIAVAGDFEAGEVRKQLEMYFGWIPNRGKPLPVDVREPLQKGERTFNIHDAQARVPGVAFIYSGMPERGTPAYYALCHLGRLLFSGKSSRLFQLLVKDEQVATAVDEPYTGGLGFPITDWEEYRAPGLFGGFILHKPDVSPQRVKALVYGALEKIAAEGVTEEELDRSKTKFRSYWITSQQTTQGRAWTLLRAAILDGDPAAANSELGRFMAVRPEDIRSAAAAYLRPDAANVFILSGAKP